MEAREHFNTFMPGDTVEYAGRRGKVIRVGQLAVSVNFKGTPGKFWLRNIVGGISILKLKRVRDYMETYSSEPKENDNTIIVWHSRPLHLRGRLRVNNIPTHRKPKITDKERVPGELIAGVWNLKELK